MAAVSLAPGLPSAQMQPEESLSTIPDPRSPMQTPQVSRSNSTSHPHPELSNEVATLSNKLIHAINHQTDLDDTLGQTRHELEASRLCVRRLEHAAQEHNSLIANGILVKKADMEADNLRLRVNLAEERKQRARVENDKKSIEQELETLTTALFEEANQMVSAARKDAQSDREGVERRNEQLQAQLNDAELLLASHQEQLSELKNAMQEMSANRNDLEVAANSSTAPSTPAPDANEHISRIFDALHLSPTIPGGDEVAPAPPTSYTHLLSPILRTDVQAYEDFSSLMEVSRKSGPPSRVTSGTYSGLSGLGLSNLTKGEQSHLSGRMPSNGSTSSLSGSTAYNSSPSTPNLPPSTNSSFSSPLPVTPLKETMFYKRVLAEDIEPTLRLDIAPGLSWLARRSVFSSMYEGRLIVEPVPSAAKLYESPCSLCGEHGRLQKQARNHRFRTNGSESAQTYPLCEYCLSRVRSSCDFLNFLRMIKDGHWRTNGSHAEAAAWEECVRLRERMFWSRIGGGVIPAFLRGRVDSPRSSTDQEKVVSALTESQNDSTSSGAKPSQSLPLNRDTSPVQDELSAQVVQAEPQLSASEGIARERPTIQKTTIDADGQKPRGEPETTVQNYARPSLGPTSARSCSSNPSERSNKRSVAQRAAMFEKTPSDDVAASIQLQSMLQASVQGRPPAKGRSNPPIGTQASSDPNLDVSRAHQASGSIPGSFNF